MPRALCKALPEQFDRWSFSPWGWMCVHSVYSVCVLGLQQHLVAVCKSQSSIQGGQ